MCDGDSGDSRGYGIVMSVVGAVVVVAAIEAARRLKIFG